MRRRVTEEECISALQAFAAREGRAPSLREWTRSKLSPSHTTIQSVLGSWSGGLRRAGLPTRPPLGEGGLTDADIDGAIARIRAGERVVTVAYDCGVTATGLRWRIRGYLERIGQPPLFERSGPRLTQVDLEQEQLADLSRLRSADPDGSD